MIHITESNKCCGCEACIQACPKQCITTLEDREGFLYPSINKESCTNCGLCEKVCPVISPQDSKKPIKTLAARNNNIDTRLSSSSGGIFTALAEETLKNGGVVFGAAFNKKWEVCHTYIESKEQLHKLRGSKYVQSHIRESYKQARTFLKENREVLFSGTPCQIAGLKRFLCKEYNNLKTVDVVCHGVPSPKVWKKYLEELSTEHNIAKITDIQFRDKTEGWNNFSLSIKFEDLNGAQNVFRETLNTNIFMSCFLKDLCLRPSCYACPARSGKSNSDITLADLWGAESLCQELDDNKGVSLILLRNHHITLPNLEIKEIEYNKALGHNKAIEYNAELPKKRKSFFRIMQKQGVHKATVSCLSKSKFEILKEKIIWNIKNRILK